MKKYYPDKIDFFLSQIIFVIVIGSWAFIKFKNFLLIFIFIILVLILTYAGYLLSCISIDPKTIKGLSAAFPIKWRTKIKNENVKINKRKALPLVIGSWILSDGTVANDEMLIYPSAFRPETLAEILAQINQLELPKE